MTARWSLVSTMHGVPETILPCIAHHLQSDADVLHIYLDTPNPTVEAALATQPRCLLTVCDEAYWSTHSKGRPDGVVRRQMANLRHAKRNGTSDWLVHVDSDEFLVSANPETALSLGAELSRLPDHHDWARIRPLERVLPAGVTPETIFDGCFRDVTTDPSLITAVYGDAAPFLHKGLSGHTRGKIAFRRATRLKPRLHDAVFPPAPGTRLPATLPDTDLPPFSTLAGTRLLHFNGWTNLHWQSKLMRFVEAGKTTGHNGGRRAAIGFLAANTDRDARQRLYDRVHRLSQDGQALLHGHGVLRLHPFSPEILTRRTFPTVDLDFSVEAFDARLKATDPDFYRRQEL